MIEGTDCQICCKNVVGMGMGMVVVVAVVVAHPD